MRCASVYPKLNLKSRLSLVCLAAVLALASACGGGGGNPQPQNQAPVAALSLSSSAGLAPLLVELDAAASSDDNGIVRFDWDFNGDNLIDATTSSNSTTSFVFTEGANVQVQVTDAGGLSDIATATLTIAGAQRTLAEIDNGPDNSGVGIALAMVSGAPAVAYVNVDTERLFYSRAVDSGGASWGVPLDLDAVQQTDVRLAVVAGRPAILYNRGVNRDLVYIRAANAEGSAWGEPVVVRAGDDPSGVGNQSLLEVAGRPAVLADVRTDDAGSSQALYLRAEDAEGASWPATGVELSPATGNSARGVLMLAEGRPLVVQDIGDEITATRALDAEGNAWPAAGVLIASGIGDIDGPFVLGEVDGRPYLAADIDNTLQIFQASDGAGSDWEALGSFGANLRPRALSLLGGFPLLAVTDADDALLLLTGKDVEGSDYQLPLTFAANNSEDARMLVIQDKPVFAHYNKLLLDPEFIIVE
jgi:hypothetical protein